MYGKSILKNALLVTLMAASAFILYAQVNNKRQAPTGNQAAATATDSLPPVDNTEGLAELDKIMKRYEDGNLFLIGEISFYENGNTGAAPQEKISFTSVTVPGATSYEVDSVQTISAGGLVVMVDKKEKTMAVVEHDTETEQPSVAGDMISAIKEFKEYIYSIQVSKSGNDKKLSIIFKEESPANTNSYEVTYEPETYRIKRVRMEIADAEITTGDENANEDDELVIADPANNELPTGYYAPDIKLHVYEVIYKTEKKAEPSLIDLDKFVIRGNDGYQPAERYKHYELLN